jgi:UrcA family protein
MKKSASISRISWLVCSAFGCAFGADLVLAEQTADVVVQVDRPEITVKMRPGSAVKEVSLAQHVSYADLNLTTSAGVTELEKRVRVAAATVCKKLDDVYPGDSVYPTDSSNGRSCTETSVKEAMHKVRVPTIAAIRQL